MVGHGQEVTEVVHVPITVDPDHVLDLDHIIQEVDLVQEVILVIEDVWIDVVVSVVDMVIEALTINQDSNHTKVVEVIFISCTKKFSFFSHFNLQNNNACILIKNLQL